MNKVYNISTSQVATAKLDLHALMPQSIPDDTIRMWLSENLSNQVINTDQFYCLTLPLVCCSFVL